MMPTNNVQNWLCLYIYIKPPFEKFLVECILPLTDELEKERIISNYFFIRYGDGGAHIRYRIFIVDTALQRSVQNNVCKKILNYIKKNEIECSSSMGTYITVNKYEPEYERYLGYEGVKTAEKVFNYSSNTILNLLKYNPTYSYNNILLFAAVLNYTMIYTLIREQRIIAEVFLYNYRRWLSKRYTSLNRQLTLVELDKETQKKFTEKFDSVKGVFLPFIKGYHQQIVSNIYRDFVIKNWVENIFNLKEELKDVVDNYLIKNIQNKHSPKVLQYSLYDSYIHMNNNRLGVRNQDESFISYLVYCAIKEFERNE